jgi:hypothetical protein
MADNYTVLDSTAATITKAGKDIGSGVQADKVHVVDASGTAGLIPGTAATSLGKAEDAAHSSGDTGVAVFAVRRDTAASGAGSDGDYATINVDSSGRLYVVLTGNAANDITKAEDAAHTSADAGVAMLAVRRDTAAVGSGTDGDYSTVNVDANGRLHTRVGYVDPPATVYAGQTNVTTAGTEVTLRASQALTQGVWVKAKLANTGIIYVGVNPVTSTTGYQLDNGEAVFLPIADIATIFIDASVSGEGVSYVGF